MTFRVLSHLIPLPGPNPSLSAPPCPPGLCSHYIIWVRTAVRLHHQSSSLLPVNVFLTFGLILKASAHKALVYIYRKCTANVLKNTGVHFCWRWAFSLLALHQSHLSGVWTNTQFYLIIRHNNGSLLLEYTEISVSSHAK